MLGLHNLTSHCNFLDISHSYSVFEQKKNTQAKYVYQQCACSLFSLVVSVVTFFLASGSLTDIVGDSRPVNPEAGQINEDEAEDEDGHQDPDD